MKHSKISLAIASAAVLAVGTQFAGAAPTIKISDGTTTVTITDNGSLDIDNTLAGVVTYSGSIGTWSTTLSSGVSKPEAGAATKPNMDLTFRARGTGTLTIWFSDDFFGPTSGSLIANIGGTTVGSVTYSTLLNTGNVLFQGTQVTSEVYNATSAGADTPYSGAASGPGTASYAFSLTQKIVINHTTTGLSSGDATLNIPDGGTTLALLGGSLLGLGVIRRKLVKA